MQDQYAENLNKNQATSAVIFFSMLLMVCLIYSKFILSVSMIGLLLCSILYKKRNFTLRISLPYLLTTGLFFLVLLSILNSHNLADWLHHVKMKLPFLVLPLAFYNLPSIRERDYYGLHYFFGLLIFVAAIPPLINYLRHFYEFQEAIGQGKAISLPVQHIKFSLFLAFGIISLIVLYRKKFIFKWPLERKLQLVLIGLSVIMLHLLAVRTGIVVFYFTLIILAFLDGVMKGRWKNMILVVLFLSLFPVVSYYTIPSFHQKVNYMVWDYGKLNLGEGEGYSDSERLESIRVGWSIVKENWLFGTGIGDLKDECRNRYQERYGPEKYVLYPHNQYLFVAAGLGLVGLICFLLFLMAPYSIHLSYIHPLLLILGIVAFTTFFIDNFLERSVGVGFYVFFLCLGLKFLDEKNTYKTE